MCILGQPCSTAFSLINDLAFDFYGDFSSLTPVMPSCGIFFGDKHVSMLKLRIQKVFEYNFHKQNKMLVE